MPRVLSDDLNELKIYDNISESEIVLSYRMPTTTERTGYGNEVFQRQGRKVKARVIETRRKYGLKILAAVRDGDFVRKVDGETVPLSCNPQSPHYEKDWKKIIETYASDIVEVLAARVFDMPAEVEPVEDEDENTAEDAEKN